VSLVGPLANLCLLPLVEGILCGALASLALGLVHPAVSACLNQANALLAEALLIGVGFFSHLPWAALPIPTRESLALRPAVRILLPQLPEGRACIVAWEGRGWLWYQGDFQEDLRWVEAYRNRLGVCRWEAVCAETEPDSFPVKQYWPVVKRWAGPGAPCDSTKKFTTTLAEAPGFSLRWWRSKRGSSLFLIQYGGRNALVVDAQKGDFQDAEPPPFLTSLRGRTDCMVLFLPAGENASFWRYGSLLWPRFVVVAGTPSPLSTLRLFGWTGGHSSPRITLWQLRPPGALEFRWNPSGLPELLGAQNLPRVSLGIATGSSSP
jgi:hypothetical protein